MTDYVTETESIDRHFNTIKEAIEQNKVRLADEATADAVMLAALELLRILFQDIHRIARK